MKTRKSVTQITRLTTDSQKRLLAYTTAAGVGAFFAGHSVEAQVVESLAFAPYPQTLMVPNGTGPNHDYNYFSVDGGGAEFDLVTGTTRITFAGAGSSSSSDFALNPTSSRYIIPWTSGQYIGPSSGSKWTYKGWLADEKSPSTYLFNKFPTTGALAFEFVSGLDNQVHFGYMDVQVNNSNPGGYGNFSVTVADIYYNETPNAGITIGEVPEPSSLALLAAGIVGLAMRRTRHVRAK